MLKNYRNSNRGLKENIKMQVLLDYLHKVFTWATKRNLWPVSFKAEENVDEIFNIVKKE